MAGAHAVDEGGFRAVFGFAAFRAICAAHAVSMAGDQFARVALSVLVFDRTRSAGLTALTYALTFLPDVVSGPMLAGLADRYPRRRVMIVADVLRAGLVAVMAVPGLPLPVVAVLLVVVQLAAAPAKAARTALLAQLLPGEGAFRAGKGALDTAGQAAQVAGFAGGGALVAAIGPSGVLLADAGTFALSALLVGLWVPPGPAPAGATAGERGSWLGELAAGAVLVWRDRRLRALVAYATVAGTYIAGEALAVPYATELGGGPVLVGLLFAGFAAGAVAGMLVLVRLPRVVALRLLPPLAVVACLPLVLCAASPGAALVVALFAASGVGSSYHLVASTTFVLAVPDHRRGQAFGLAATALTVSQGLGVALAGAVAERIAPHLVVALMGGLGVVAAVGAAWMWWTAGGPPADADEPRQPAASPEPG